MVKMKLFRKLFFLLIIILVIFSIIFLMSGYPLYKEAVNEKSLPDKVSEIRSDENFVSYNDLPKNLINATVAVEDHRFWNHGAIDPIGITRAIFSNIKAKNAVQGGSTITQQVSKNLYFMEEDDGFKRKSAELIMSYKIAKTYSKEEIMELYVNTIYYGNGYYGIKEAANGYYNKDPKDLTLAECTLLAGVPNAPSVYAPTANMELCKSRQSKVIKDMVKYGYITQEQADSIELGMWNLRTEEEKGLLPRDEKGAVSEFFEVSPKFGSCPFFIPFFIYLSSAPLIFTSEISIFSKCIVAGFGYVMFFPSIFSVLFIFLGFWALLIL